MEKESRMKRKLSEFKLMMRLVLRTWAGKVGFGLLAVFIILGVYVMIEYYPETTTNYMRGYLWLNKYPESVPPCWVVKEKAQVVAANISDLNTTGIQEAMIPLRGIGKIIYVKGYQQVFWYAFNYTADAPPTDVDMILSVYVGDKTLNPKLIAYIERPDGKPVVLYNGTIKKGSHLLIGIISREYNITMPSGLSKISESSPLYRYIVESLAVIYGSKDVVKTGEIGELVFLEGGSLNISEMNVLKGTYNVTIILQYRTARGASINDTEGRITLEDFVFKTRSNCYGYFGTDQWGRPIGLGLLLGIPYAFYIGFLVTFTSTLIGAFYGVAAGYWKGARSELMMRVVDVVNSLPFLPILIALAFVFRTRMTLSLLSFLMIILFWAAPVIVIRSMALQISEQPYIEAAKATGAGTARILFKYIFPQILPYTVAVAVLSIPSIIVTEASLSLLGLGDPTAPTWGKMLENAYYVQSVVRGWWWLYIFPGLALAIFSATFLLIGRAIEPIVAPKLQK